MAGREKGQVVERKAKGYIIIKENELRVKVDADCLILEEKTGVNKDTGEIIYGNNKYYTTWDQVLTKLVRIYTAEKLSKKEIVSFTEAREEYISAINELKIILIGEIDSLMKTSSEDIKKTIIKFNI